jgi:hypothetical protein
MEPNDFAALVAPLRRPLTQRTTFYQAATAHIATASSIPNMAVHAAAAARRTEITPATPSATRSILDLDQERPRTQGESIPRLCVSRRRRWREHGGNPPSDDRDSTVEATSRR